MTVSSTATAMAAPVLTPPAPAEGGLLLSELDPWGDAGLLNLATTTTAEPAEPQSLRSFIAEAYPRYGFHHWAEVLIDLLQAVADGQLRISLRPLRRTRRSWPMPTAGKRATSTG
jgi:hypothetical protein